MYLNVFYRFLNFFYVIIWHSALMLPRYPCCGCRSFNAFYVCIISTRCVFFSFYKRQPMLFFPSNFYLAAVFWLWAERYWPPLPKEQEHTVCTDLRSVPLHLAWKVASILLRSCAISTTDDTLMDAMEDQQESLASICSMQPTNVSPVL